MSDSKSLKQLVDSTSQLENLLIESDGEITPEIEALLVINPEMHVQLPAKVDSYALFMDRMDMVSEFYKSKAQDYLKLSKSAESVIERCKANLKFAMESLHTDELKGFDVRFKLVASQPKVIIDDESKIDQTYKKEVIEISIDKKQIAKDLKDGAPVEGAHLEPSFSLRTFANSPAAQKKVSSK